MFGVGLDEYLTWNFARYQHHKAYAMRELARRRQSDLLAELGVPVDGDL